MLTVLRWNLSANDSCGHPHHKKMGWCSCYTLVRAYSLALHSASRRRVLQLQKLSLARPCENAHCCTPVSGLYGADASPPEEAAKSAKRCLSLANISRRLDIAEALRSSQCATKTRLYPRPLRRTSRGHSHSDGYDDVRYSQGKSVQYCRT